MHRIAIGSSRTPRADCDLRQRVPRLVPLPLQPRNHPRRRVILVQRRAELLSCLRKLLLQLERLERYGVPLVLEGGQEGGDRGEGGRAWTDDARGLELDEVVGRQFFAVDWVRAVLGDVGLDQALLEDIA